MPTRDGHIMTVGELKRFVLQVDRDMMQYQSIEVMALDEEDARERFYDGVYVVLGQHEKVRDTIIWDVQEEE